MRERRKDRRPVLPAGLARHGRREHPGTARSAERTNAVGGRRVGAGGALGATCGTVVPACGRPGWVRQTRRVTDDLDGAGLLDRRVAEAADAWLTDPRDAGVYARLVAAVIERRAALDVATHPGETDVVADGSQSDDEPDPGEPDAELDPASAPVGPLRPVGADLLGDPRAVLERLRRG